MNKLNNLLSNILTILSILAAFSFIFFLFGLIYKLEYYDTLNIPFNLLDYQYYTLTTVGFLLYLPLFIAFLAFVVPKLYLLFLLHQSETNLKIVNNDLENTKGNEKEVSVLKKAVRDDIDNIKCLRKKIFSSWNSKSDKIMLFIIFVSTLIFLVASMLYNNNYDYLSILMLYSIQFIIGYYLYNKIKITAENWRIGLLHILNIVPLLIIIVLTIPFVMGFIEAKTDIKNDKFSKVIIYEVGQSYEAGYLFSNNNNYYIRKNNAVFTVPSSNILKIEWK